MTLIGINVAILWAALIVDKNDIVVVLLARVFGVDTHSVKATLIIVARRTIQDDIKNALHLIGASYDEKIFVVFTHIVDALFYDNLMTVVLVLMATIIDDYLVMIRGFVWIIIGILGPDLLATIST